mgnify:FL=1
MDKKPFSFDTIRNFDNHISSSIMGYDILHLLLINISSFFIKKNTNIVDLGCTSGKLMKSLKSAYHCTGTGYDITDANFIDNDGDLIKADITSKEFELPKSDLIFCIFTLQFIDYEKRLDLLKKICSALSGSGAFVFCEKEICSDGVIQEVFTFSNYEYKKNVFTEAEILQKEYDLRSIMTPLQTAQNVELLRKAGFTKIEPFFQSLNFKGYICRK